MKKRAPAYLATTAGMLLLVGCYTSTLHTTGHTWREQHLLTLAVEEAVKGLPTEDLGPEAIGISVSTHVEGAGPFLEAAFRSRLKKMGFRVSEALNPMRCSQLLNIVVDAAASESSRKRLEIPIPIPFVFNDSLGIPLYERSAAWAWVEYSGWIMNTANHEVVTRIGNRRGHAYWYEYTYIGLIGPFYKSSIPDHDPIFQFDWE